MIRQNMQHHLAKKLGIVALSLSSLLASTAAQASLLNTDFSTGFDSWQGEVINNNFDFIDIDDLSLYPSAFSLSNNAVSIATTDEYWSALMFQEFSLTPLADATDISLSLNVSANLTDPDPLFGDFLVVQLRDVVTNDVLDLSAGGSFSLTSWAGRDVSLEFGLQDFDFNIGDVVTISDISLDVNQVSAPATGALFALGLLALVRRKS